MKTLKERQLDWVIAWQDKSDESALVALIDSLMGLVNKQANRLRASGADREDLVAAGRLGIMIAVNRFDRYRHNAMISAAAANYIKNEMIMFANAVATPASAAISRREQDIQRHARGHYAKLVDDGMTRSQAAFETAQAFRTDTLHIASLLEARQPVFLDAPSEEGGFDIAAEERGQIDTIDERRLPDLIELAMEQAELTERERFCLRARFLEGEDMNSLDTVAERYGVSRERARQVIAKALGRMRAHFERQGLELSDLV